MLLSNTLFPRIGEAERHVRINFSENSVYSGKYPHCVTGDQMPEISTWNRLVSDIITCVQSGHIHIVH